MTTPKVRVPGATSRIEMVSSRTAVRATTTPPVMAMGKVNRPEVVNSARVGLAPAVWAASSKDRLKAAEVGRTIWTTIALNAMTYAASIENSQ